MLLFVISIGVVIYTLIGGIVAGIIRPRLDFTEQDCVEYISGMFWPIIIVAALLWYVPSHIGRFGMRVPDLIRQRLEKKGPNLPKATAREK